MSGTYTSKTSLLDDIFWVDLLSQRDVSAQIPINYVTHSSIALTAACFGDKEYNGDSGSLCLSDLLTVGYSRFIIDIYWSYENQQWLLCPVSYPLSTAANSSSNAEYTLGDYTCSGSFTATTILDVFHSYIDATRNSYFYSVPIYVLFDMHAAAESDNPDQPPPTVSVANLPSESLSLGSLVNRGLGSYIYTPLGLTQQRSDLNNSWFKETGTETTVLSDYFTTRTDSTGVQSTPDGWPCQSYLLNKLSKGIIFGQRSIDPQLQYYNITADGPFIFPSDELESFVSFSNVLDESASQSGCFYNSNYTNVQNVNNSWAIANVDTTQSKLQNYTSCGISPFINQTRGNTSAYVDIDPYRDMSMSALWSWAPGEPKNVTSLPGYRHITNTENLLRCAFMDPSAGGHWRAGNCSKEYRAACRMKNKPYTWTLSDGRQSFPDSSKACSTNTYFDAPRTGLENTYFYNQVLSTVGNDSANEPIWINFNSLDVEYCWVLGGANASCPYTSDADDVERRTILVPTIAAIIILAITAATIFVKCNSNRRMSRRKRVSEGWEYEGVPS